MIKVQHSHLHEKDLSEVELDLFNSLYDELVTVCHEDGDSYLVLTYLGLAECREYSRDKLRRFLEAIGILAAIISAILSGISVYGAITL